MVLSDFRRCEIHNREDKFWSYFSTFNIVVSLSAIYEIFEWIAAASVNHALASAFLGSSDVFDTQKDMVVSVIGAILAFLIVITINHYRNNDKLLAQTN